MIVLASVSLVGVPEVERLIQQYGPNQAAILKAEGEKAVDEAIAEAVNTNSKVTKLTYIFLIAQGIVNTLGLVYLAAAIGKIRAGSQLVMASRPACAIPTPKYNQIVLKPNDTWKDDTYREIVEGVKWPS
jgi:hypothetical protein